MMSLSFLKTDRPLNILCLGAHCDDIEIGCGGTILKLQEEFPDAVVQWVVFSGSTQRRTEFESSSLTFLNSRSQSKNMAYSFPDSYFPHAWKEIKDCFELLKTTISPDLVFTHYRDDRHQDHRIISELTLNTFRNHLIFEYEIPKYDGDFSSPNFYFSLPQNICQKKISSILECYPSQASKNWFTEDTFRAVLRLRGIESNSPSGFAEGFYLHKGVYL